MMASTSFKSARSPEAVHASFAASKKLSAVGSRDPDSFRFQFCQCFSARSLILLSLEFNGLRRVDDSVFHRRINLSVGHGKRSCAVSGEGSQVK